jgi:hypothetical protein
VKYGLFFLRIIFSGCFVFYILGGREVGRDPFYLPQIQKIKKQKTIFKLKSVCSGHKGLGALIHVNNEPRIIFLNDHIAGYVVQDISLDHVILARGKVKIKLE